MCYTEDLLITSDPFDHLAFKRHYEKLGDGACHLRNYAGAVEYYIKMLDHAILAGECGKTLIPVYVRYLFLTWSVAWYFKGLILHSHLGLHSITLLPFRLSTLWLM